MTVFALHRMLFAVACLLLALALAMEAARAHDHYTSWKQPANGASCCDNRDCRPTRARMTDAETWQAWDGERWIDIPPHTILKMQSPDGRNHLCEAYGVVFCFLPSGPKS